MKTLLTSCLALLILCGCSQTPKAKDVKINISQGISLLQTPLIRRQLDLQIDSLRIENYLDALRHFNINNKKPNNIVWLGRRIAYLGDYKRAIEVYTEGINKFPEDARFYRHRGHRYISTRQLDEAITDFKKAANLIKNTDDVIEPDGVPNRLNQPVSSLHTNIWYHLGLAYYLKNDLQSALAAFNDCLTASKNDDMQVATRHWLYMILRKMDRQEDALAILDPIQKNMNIIENTAYHNLLLFYKGILTEEGVIGDDALGSSEAVLYGIANWHSYNGNTEKAKSMFSSIIDNGNWSGFGYIASEAELSRME